MNATIRTAVAADLDAVAPLFDAYRQFYGQPADPARARAFIGERLRRGDAVILLALRDGTAAGFAQLYPLFSSVRTGRIWQLNDLYVAPSARRHGVGRALLAAARDHAAASGALGRSWKPSAATPRRSACTQPTAGSATTAATCTR